jgi:isopenicillin N synthase-like dioxygenase
MQESHVGMYLARGAFRRFSGVSSFPIIDIRTAPSQQAAKQIYEACSTWGGFIVTGHDVPTAVQREAFVQAKAFFALPLEDKIKLHVRHGGLAWRGYMPLGGEQSRGRVDQKEGLYVGPEHGPEHPHCKAQTPLYGRNLFPDQTLPSLRPAVLTYIEEVTHLGHRLMELVSLSLGLEAEYIRRTITVDPLALVRLFRYPPTSGRISPTDGATSEYGIGEHTDYGLWTLLQTDALGLQVKHPSFGWSDVPLVEDGFICTVGDVLDRLTAGHFKSRPHRVVNNSKADRISIPYFFDPSWNAPMKPLPLEHLPPAVDPDQEARWSKTSIVKLEGEYSAFLAKKVFKIFSDVIPESVAASLDTTRGPSTRFAIKIPINKAEVA